LNWQDQTNPHAGGAETHLHEIFSRVAARGHTVTLFCSSFDGAAANETQSGIHVIREGHRNTFNAHVPLRYFTRFRHEHYDVVVDDVNKIPFYTPLYVREPLLVLAHHLFGTSIFAEAGVAAGLYVVAAERLLGAVYRHAEFAVVSPSTRDDLARHGIPPERMSIIHNCIDHSRFAFSVPTKHPRPTIVYLGRLKRYKSVHHILEALPLVLRSVPEARVVIMGKGDDEPRLRSLAAALGIESHVEFTGFVAESEKASALGAAHCMVNPSLKEGWGIINIEANAAGTPVISADSPGLRDSVRDGESGLLYEYGNIEQLADRITRVLQDSRLREHLSHGAVEYARGFNWETSASQMIERLEGVIEKNEKNEKSKKSKQKNNSSAQHKTVPSATHSSELSPAPTSVENA
jgi:glycosyltransferase involved in cell wall biosynthesis